MQIIYKKKLNLIWIVIYYKLKEAYIQQLKELIYKQV